MCARCSIDLLRVRLFLVVWEGWLAVGRGIGCSGRGCARCVRVLDLGGGDLCVREGSCLSCSVERKVWMLAVSLLFRWYCCLSVERAWAMSR